MNEAAASVDRDSTQLSDARSVMRKVFAGWFSRARSEEMSIDLGHLTRLVRRYSVEQQQVPRDLNELVALRYLEAIPIAPAGQKFVIDRKMVEVRLE